MRIKNNSQYQQALVEINRLFFTAQKDTPDGQQLEYLAALVDVYEREHFSIEKSSFLEAVKFRSEQHLSSWQRLFLVLPLVIIQAILNVVIAATISQFVLFRLLSFPSFHNCQWLALVIAIIVAVGMYSWLRFNHKITMYINAINQS